MSKVLIVDDEPNMRRILNANLRADSHLCAEASSSAEAMALLSSDDFDVVITDQKMPGGSGMDVLRAVQKNDPTISVVFLTAVGTVELAVESMRQGAFDFLTKPFDVDVMKATVRRASERTRLLRENAVLRTTVRKLEGAEEIIGKSTGIQSVRDLIARVAGTNSTVLITGETGTGKELVARAIHRNSARAQRPFVAINCAAVTETLLESELFGHERGAFTGADKARGGLFEAAHEGTLFLDEVAEMSSAAQSKLLRVLANGEIQRVGSTSTRRVDVRVVVATNRDLRERVKDARPCLRCFEFALLRPRPLHHDDASARGWSCAICWAIDDRNTAIEFTLCETFGWKIFERTQNFGFVDSFDCAIRLDFILQPSTRPDLLAFAPLYQRAFLVPSSCQRKTCSPLLARRLYLRVYC